MKVVEREDLETYFDLCKVICRNVTNGLKEDILGFVDAKVYFDTLEVKITKYENNSDAIDFEFKYQRANFLDEVQNNSEYTASVVAEVKNIYKSAVLRKYFKRHEEV